ncbi:MAG: hypothetical protein EP315_03865, partial [Gammaproteobacteria bacterium]
MVVDIDNDEDLLDPSDDESPGPRPRKMLFTDGLDFSAEALPICAYCKRVRDRQGKWHPVDRRMILLNDVKLIQITCDQCKPKHTP